MQEKHFAEYFISQETIFPYLIKLLLKKLLEKPSSKSFPMGTRSKTLFLTSATAVDTQQILKIQSRLWSNQKLFNHYHHAKII